MDCSFALLFRLQAKIKTLTDEQFTLVLPKSFWIGLMVGWMSKEVEDDADLSLAKM